MANIITSCGTDQPATGFPQQSQMIWDGTNYWCFYGSSAHAGYLCYQNTTIPSSWPETSTTVEATSFPNDARLFRVVFQPSNNCILVAWWDSVDNYLSYLRGTISGTTILWSSIINISTSLSPTTVFGVLGCILSTGVPMVAVCEYTFPSPGYSTIAYIATDILNSSFSDSVTSWSESAFGYSYHAYPVNAVYPLSSGHALAIVSNWSFGTQDVGSVYFNGSWVSPSSIYSNANASETLWSSAQISPTNIAVLGVSAASTFSFAQYNGSSWSTITAPSWPLNGLASTSSVTLQNDGTNYYAIVIDGAGYIEINTWNGSSWSGWSILPGDVADTSRAYIQAGPYVSSASTIDLIYTHTNGGNYEIWTTSVVASGSSPGFTWSHIQGHVVQATSANQYTLTYLVPWQIDAGDCIILSAAYWGAGTSTTVSDNVNGTYNPLLGASEIVSGYPNLNTWYIVAASTSLANTLTITWSITGSSVNEYAAMVVDIIRSTGSHILPDIGGDSSNYSGTSSISLSSPLTPAGNDFIYAVALSGSAGTFSAGSGFTLGEGAQESSVAYGIQSEWLFPEASSINPSMGASANILTNFIGFAFKSFPAYIELPSGGIGLGGRASPTAAYHPAPGGGMSFGAHAGTAVAWHPSPGGGVRLGGHAGPTVAYHLAPGGGTSFGAHAGPTVAYHPSPGGGTSFGAHAGPTVAYHPSPGGGLDIGGQSSPSKRVTFSAGGGMSFGAHAGTAVAWHPSPGGGVRLGGHAGPTVAYHLAPSGGMGLGAQAVRLVVFKPGAHGGMNFGGSSVPSGIAIFVASASGGMRYGGAVPVNSAWILHPAGGMRYGGVALYNPAVFTPCSGGMAYGGSVIYLPPRAWLGSASGGMSLGGVAFVSYPGIRYKVYRNTGVGDPVNYATPIDTTYLLTFSTGPLAYPGTWKFAVRAENDYGEERNVDAVITLILSGSGYDITAIPAQPKGLTVAYLLGGALRILWLYPVAVPGKLPQGFHAYCTPGSTINYATPAATVGYVPGMLRYSTDLSGLVDGSYTIGVRAYNRTGDDGNTLTVQALIDTTVPGQVDDLMITLE